MIQRRAVSGLLFLLPWAGSVVRAQTQDDVFDDTIVQEVRLDIRPSDWETLKQNYLENTYYPVVFHWIYKGKDIAVRDTEIRSRGHGSRSPIKPNLRIDFNRDVPGQMFFGLSSLVMKANNQDASMLRERAVFKLWDRTGLPASREAHCRLYINNAYIGVFLLTEEIRTEYLNRYLGEGDSDLYEWKPIDSYHFEWYPNCSARKDGVACSTDPNKWQPIPYNPEENKKTFDLGPTIDMVRAINQTADADFERVMSGYTDLKLFLFHVAIENVVADFDSILGDVFGMNNFWLYRYDKTNFHQFLLWDKDSSYDYMYRPIFQNADQNVLMRRTLALTGRKNQYLESLYKVAVLAGGPGGWMEWENNREYTLIRDAVYADTNKQHDNQNYDNAFWESEVQKNLQFLDARAPWVRAEVATNGLQIPSTVVLSDGGAVNAATNLPGPIAPGSWVSLYGSGFTNQTQGASTNPFPTKLGGVSVIINGFVAPLQFISANQINFQAPWELGVGNGTAPVTVMIDGAPIKGTRANSPVGATFSNTITAPVGVFAPGVYAITQASGALVSSSPAGADDILIIYATGLGPLDTAVATGALAPGSQLVHTTQLPVVTIDGVQAEVQFSGLTPGTAGLYQINIKVPAGIRSGTATLSIRAGGASSPQIPLPTR